jgi:hypothetical protein
MPASVASAKLGKERRANHRSEMLARSSTQLDMAVVFGSGMLSWTLNHHLTRVR